jgi:hypothetical protein
MRLGLCTALAGLLTACVAFDEKLEYEEEIIYEDPDRRPESTPDPDPEQEQGVEVPEVVLEPSEGQSGDVFIVSLSFDGSTDAEVDELTFFGTTDVEVLAWSDWGENELAVTLSIPSGAKSGAQDLLVELSDGDAWFIEDALTVVPAF